MNIVDDRNTFLYESFKLKKEYKKGLGWKRAEEQDEEG